MYTEKQNVMEECVGITSLCAFSCSTMRLCVYQYRCRYFRANSSNVSLTFGSATGFHKAVYLICLSIFMSIWYSKSGLS